MPFKSEKQRKYMYAKHPEIAKRWQKEGKGSVAGYGSAKKTSAPKAKMAAAKKSVQRKIAVTKKIQKRGK